MWVSCEIEQNMPEFFIFWRDKAREYTQKPLHSPKVIVRWGFTGSFVMGQFFFETEMSGKQLRWMLSVICFCARWSCHVYVKEIRFHVYANGKSYHIATAVKEFLIQTFRKTKSFSGIHMVYSASRFDSENLLVMGIFKILGFIDQDYLIFEKCN